MREELLRWMRSGQVTEMVYVDRHGTFSERRVKLIKVQGEYVVAWDLNKQARPMTGVNVSRTMPIRTPSRQVTPVWGQPPKTCSAKKETNCEPIFKSSASQKKNQSFSKKS